jgi:hypothetical protein
MIMEQYSRLTFIKGMNTDTDVSMLDGNSYLRAENFTLTSAGGGTIGALENVKGNEQITAITIAIGHVIVGVVSVVKDLVIFTKNDTDGTSRIYWYKEDGTFILKFDDATTTDGSRLNFSTSIANKILGVGIDETVNIKKVYWVDGINELRYIILQNDYSQVTATVFNATGDISPDYDINTDILQGGGSYNAGTVYHCVQFLRLNGTSSSIFKLSNPIKLAENSYTKDGGDIKDHNTGAGVKINITNIPDSILDSYNIARIYAIYYTTFDTPEVNIINEVSLEGSSISLIDVGDIIDSIDSTEFASIKQTAYSPNFIESKNGRLFMADTEELSFSTDSIDNWDSRVYRFDNTPEAIVYESFNSNTDPEGIDYYVIQANGNWEKKNDTNSVITILDSGSTWDIPSDANLINKENNIFSANLNNRDTYIKNISGALGGTGKNVEYSFVDATKKIDDGYPIITEDSEFVVHNQSDLYTISDSGTVYSNLLECEAGEVYRVGIKFYNSKGQSSFVKWVGDILIPEHFDQAKVYPGTQYVYTHTKLLKVTINTFPEISPGVQDPDIKYWEVVRVARGISDKSVEANGLLTSFVESSGSSKLYMQATNQTYPRIGVNISDYKDGLLDDGDPSIPNSTVYKRIVKFISPDYMFNEESQQVDLINAKVRIYNYMNDGYPDSNTVRYHRENGNHYISRKYVGLKGLSDDVGQSEYPKNNLLNIEDFSHIDPYYIVNNINTVTGKYSIDGIQHLNYYNPKDLGGDSDFDTGAGCSSFIMKVDADIIAADADGDGYFYASILRNKDFTRYGGSFYFDRQKNEYIRFSNVMSVSDASSYCVNGDTYQNMYYYLDISYDGDGGTEEGIQAVIAFPVQSNIDVRRRSDKILDYYVGPYTLSGTAATEAPLHEKVTVGIQIHGSVYPTELGDLYNYNPIYSQEETLLKSIPKPENVTTTTIFNNKVQASELKIIGELEDNWLNFKPANFIEVDTKFGSITGLKEKDSRMYFWQEKAFGKISINERSLITDESGAQLSLGTGDVLERYDYISNSVGNVDRGNITENDNALLWVNSSDKSIYRYNGKLEELSTTRSVDTYMKSATISDPIAVHDYINKETLFKVGGEVLVFDQMTDSFSGVYTYTPTIFISTFDGNYISSEDNVNVYKHNADTVSRGSFYGTIYDSLVKHVCNAGDFNITKVFDIINWHSTSKTAGINNYGDTFSELRVYNDYQNTQNNDGSWKTLSIPTTVKRKERSFTTTIPRDNVNAPQSSNVDIFDTINLDETQAFKRRIRDKYIIIDMKYENKADTSFSVPYINVGYRKSIR